MKKKILNLKIGEIGTINISVPQIKIGSGKPRVLLLVGVHGNEISGLFVVQRLLERLELKTGELSIITAANPLAQGLRKRKNPIDFEDLNRAFPGEAGKGFTSRLATRIFAEAKKCDLVIDIHTFGDPSPIVAIFMNHGSEKVKKESLKFIKASRPDIIWQLSTQTKEEAQLSGSLGPKLAEKGVVNFAVEMPEHFRISEEQLNRVTEGLINTLSLLGMTDRKVESTQDKIPVFERLQVRVDAAGIFIPRKKLMDKVKKNEIVGEIVSIKNFRKTLIRAPLAGPLIVMKNRDLVRTGGVLCTVGRQAGEL